MSCGTGGTTDEGETDEVKNGSDAELKTYAQNSITAGNEHVKEARAAGEIEEVEQPRFDASPSWMAPMRFYWFIKSVPELRGLPRADRRRLWRSASERAMGGRVGLRALVLLLRFLAVFVPIVAATLARAWFGLGFFASEVLFLCGVAVACCEGMLWRHLDVRAALPHIRALLGRCPMCGYDLTGNASGRCPECGADALPLAITSAG